MHYALKRVASRTEDIWVPLPGLVYDFHELPVGEYLVFEASGSLKEEESGGLDLGNDQKVPRTFKFERRVVVSAPETPKPSIETV